MKCQGENCEEDATCRVSDGPAGLSPRMNIYYLCDVHVLNTRGGFENYDWFDKDGKFKYMSRVLKELLDVR